jgi:hypothetical protein
VTKELLQTAAPPTRDDVVAEYVRACSGIGSVVDHSIILQLPDDIKRTKLAEYGGLRCDFFKFRWIEDDTLIVVLAKSIGFRRKPLKLAPSVSPIATQRPKRAGGRITFYL